MSFPTFPLVWVIPKSVFNDHGDNFRPFGWIDVNAKQKSRR